MSSIPPTNLTSPDNLTQPKVGRPLPKRLQRLGRPEAKLTDAAATDLLVGGRLNQRDYLAMEMAWRFGVVTTNQVQRLAFYTVKNPRDARRVTNRRLKFLYEEYCLNRIFRGINEEMVYTLDVQGARLLQMAYQKDNQREIHWSPRSVGEKLNFLDHSLGIAEFAVNLVEAVRPYQGTLAWEGENTAAQKKRDETTFEPDSIGYVTISDRRLPFFFEYDRGSEEIRDLGTKIKNYFDLFLFPEGWKPRFESQRFPPVLITTTTTARVERILAATERALRSITTVNYDDFIVLLTTHEALSQHGVLGSCWYWVGKAQKIDLAWANGVSLLDLLGVKAGQ